MTASFFLQGISGYQFKTRQKHCVEYILISTACSRTFTVSKSHVCCTLFFHRMTEWVVVTGLGVSFFSYYLGAQYTKIVRVLYNDTVGSESCTVHISYSAKILRLRVRVTKAFTQHKQVSRQLVLRNTFNTCNVIGSSFLDFIGLNYCKLMYYRAV